MTTLVAPAEQPAAIKQQQLIQPPPAAQARPAWAYVVWILGGGILGFAISGFFAGVLQLPRAIFLLPYVAIAPGVFYAYVRWSGVNVRRAALHHWVWGLVGALAAGAFVVSNVLSQPASPAPVGLELVGALLWLGVVYGTVDALFLSILPMMATWQGCSKLGWTRHWPGRIVAGILALVASILVTAAYHLGYPEYRSGGLMGPVIGNSVMSLASLLTMSPIAAVFSHIAMHVTAVLQGVETTVQLPPHYPL